MPAAATTSVRADCRKKVGFTAAQARRLQADAHASGLTESGYIVKVLSEHWRSGDRERGLPVFPAGFKPEGPIVIRPGDNRERATFTPEERLVLESNAAACGMTKARYIHDVVVASWTSAPPPRPKRGTDKSKLVAELNVLAWQIGKLGTNVNQLAKQANTGMVQVSRAEIQYLLNQQQVLMSKVSGAVEAVLA